MHFDKGKFAATVGGTISAAGATIAVAATAAGLHVADVGARAITGATMVAAEKIATSTKAAPYATAAAVAGGFGNNGINIPPKDILLFAGGATLAVVGVTYVVLPAVGFTAAGIGANTLAATAHSYIGNVVAGTLFSSLQSGGVVGLAASTKAAIGFTGGAATVWFNKKDS